MINIFKYFILGIAILFSLISFKLDILHFYAITLFLSGLLGLFLTFISKFNKKNTPTNRKNNMRFFIGVLLIGGIAELINTFHSLR